MKRHLESKVELQNRFKNDFDSLSLSARAVLSCGPTFGIWPLSNPLRQLVVKQGDIHKTVHLHSELKTNYVFGAIRVAEVGTLSAKAKNAINSFIERVFANS